MTKVYFGLLELKFRNKWPRIMTEPNYEYAPVILLFQMHSHLGLGLLGHGQALPEIVLHEHQTIA
jgi:hypothetical protein